MRKNQSKADTQPHPNPTAAVEVPQMNIFYAFKGREEQEKSVDMVIGTLHVFSFPVYALLDPRFTLSFVLTCFLRFCMSLFYLVLT